MRCGFCGHDNPDGVKRCKNCKAKMALQQSYGRTAGSGFTGNVNQGGSGVTGTGADGSRVTRTTGGYGVSRPVPGSPRHTVNLKAARLIALSVFLIPVIITVVVMFWMIKDMKQATEWSNNLPDQLQEYYGLSENSYSLEKKSELEYMMDISGFEYKAVKSRISASGEYYEWRTDYFTDTLKRMTEGRVKEAIMNSSFGESVTKILYDVDGVFPVWLNYDEIDRILERTGNNYKWSSAWKGDTTWTILVLIIIDEDYPVTKECFDELKKDLFFATKIEIKCFGKSYRYYPYEDRYEEE